MPAPPRVRIGIAVRERADGVAATLESLRRAGDDADIVLLAGGADAATVTSLPQGIRTLTCSRALGMAACFNRLAASGPADVYVLLENGVRLGRGCLSRIVAALMADRRIGLAGPSTNRCWNEQADFPGAGGAWAEVDRTARDAASRHGNALAGLEPLHSLAEFCYAVRREVIDTVGPADEGYGTGPCWEMDYNVRAARAGFRGVWVKGAYAWRPPVPEWRRREEAARFPAARRRYQDRFCGLRLRGEKHDYEPHCRGDSCPHFAPRDRIAPSPPVATAAGGPPDAESRVAASVDTLRPPWPDTTNAPLLSCLMPTCNRRSYVPGAIAAFLSQDYEPRELVIVDDGDVSVADLVPEDARIRYVRRPRGLSLGAKRNLACSLALGEIFVHWDDDDWHAPWRIRYQVGELTRTNADLCGTDRLWFYDPARDLAWHYRYPGGRTRWVAGGTFCFRRSLWETHRFADITVGEDTRYVRELQASRVAVLDRDDFYVARVHTGNTSAKQTSGSSWHPCPVQSIRDVIGTGFEAFRRASLPLAAIESGNGELPLVSCVMPTYNRRPFVALSLQRFLEQDYPRKELIVVDDGEDRVEDLVAAVPGARYLGLTHRESIGAKRNRACAVANGSFVVQWDDDDWYGPQRISRQVEPLRSGRAQVTGIEGDLVMRVPAGEFWALSPSLQRRMFFEEVHGGTLAFARSLWSAGIRYPDTNLAEDAGFLRRALRAGATLKRIPNDGLFAYTRHAGNAWQFDAASQIGLAGWQRAAAPPGLAPAIVEQYAHALGERHA